MDLSYLSLNISSLMGLQVRIYKNDAITDNYQQNDFIPDPAELVISEIFKNDKTVDYYDGYMPFVFGSIKSSEENKTIIIGPTFNIKPGKEQLIILMKELGIQFSNYDSFKAYVESIPTYSVETFLQILSFINYSVNGEKISALDIIRQSFISPEVVIKSNEQMLANPDDINIHNTFNLEKKLTSYIKEGKTDKLQQMFSEPPVGRVGKIAHTELRQRKNTFICAATLASRAAIEGGLSQEVSLSLSDYYIQKAEMLADYNSIAILNIDMLMEFAKRVEKLHIGVAHSKELLNIIRYINKNICSKITLDNISDKFGISRTKLCDLFKSELNISVHAFIIQQKNEEAKRLLSNTERSLSEISEYLGYSSQSYFQNTFKKVTGHTPLEYRSL